MAKKNRRAIKAPNQPNQQSSTQDKSALYALYGAIVTAVFSALAQIVVAWIQRH